MVLVNKPNVRVRFHRIVERHLQQRALFWIHRRIPELLRVHFTQPFVTLNRQVFFANVIDGL
jgi:hypothetical protein